MFVCLGVLQQWSWGWFTASVERRDFASLRDLPCCGKKTHGVDSESVDSAKKASLPSVLFASNSLLHWSNSP